MLGTISHKRLRKDLQCCSELEKSSGEAAGERAAVARLRADAACREAKRAQAGAELERLQVKLAGFSLAVMTAPS